MRHYSCILCYPLLNDRPMCRSFCKQFHLECNNHDHPDYDIYPESNCYSGFDYDPLPPRYICGQFGDPHIRLFSGEYMTCKSLGENVLFTSDILQVIATNEKASEQTDATSTSKLEVIYNYNDYNQVLVSRT